MKHNLQSGAAMLEAAYVLPIIMIAILMVVESVGYALNSLKLNDVMADTYQVIMSQAQQMHQNPAVLGLTFVSCSAGKVVPVEAVVQSALTQNLVKAVSADGVTQPAGLTISVSSQTQFGVLSYLVKVSYPSQTQLLPEGLAQTFPIKAQGIFSFDLSC